MLRSVTALQIQKNFFEIVSLPSLITRSKPNRYRRRSQATRKRLLREDESLEWAKPFFDMAQTNDKEHMNVTVKQGESEQTKEPHMVHVVRRIAVIQGRPWWEKDIIKKFGLYHTMHMPVLVKNTPANNKLLREVKHLVEIQPLTFPHGIPEHESDFTHSFINSKGEMIVQKRLTEQPDSTTLENPRDKWQLDVDTIQTQLLRTRLKFDIHSEYYKTEYEYKLNQDGKEWRYRDFWKTHESQKKDVAK